MIGGATRKDFTAVLRPLKRHGGIAARDRRHKADALAGLHRNVAHQRDAEFLSNGHRDWIAQRKAEGVAHLDLVDAGIRHLERADG